MGLRGYETVCNYYTEDCHKSAGRDVGTVVVGMLVMACVLFAYTTSTRTSRPAALGLWCHRRQAPSCGSVTRGRALPRRHALQIGAVQLHSPACEPSKLEHSSCISPSCLSFRGGALSADGGNGPPPSSSLEVLLFKR